NTPKVNCLMNTGCKVKAMLQVSTPQSLHPQHCFPPALLHLSDEIDAPENEAAVYCGDWLGEPCH
ncbi:MAG: hypothetical protein VXX31_05710, partial [Planctomycetota bacterium]|nr:hypothetical protein [Planctomycetota bacterium]